MRRYECMHKFISTKVMPISELRKSPAKSFAAAVNGAIAVLNHDKPAGYIFSNNMVEKLLDVVANEMDVALARTRMAQVKTAKRVGLDDL